MTVVSALGGFGGGSRNLLVAEPVQFAAVGENQGAGLGRRLQVLLEPGGECGESLVQLAQLPVSGIVESGTGQDKIQLVAPDEGGPLVGGSEIVQRAVHRVDPGEKPSVEPDLIVVRGQPRRELRLDRPDLRAGQRRRQVEEQIAGACEQRASHF